MGIVTKCDRISSRRLAEVKEFVSSDTLHNMSLGCVCTMNATDKKTRTDQAEVDINLDEDDLSSLTTSERAPSSKRFLSGNGTLHDTDHTPGIGMIRSDSFQMGLFASDSSNYGRLIRQCHEELIWFKTNNCNDLLAKGQAGTPAVICKLYDVYVSHMKQTWLPQTLKVLMGQSNALQSEEVSLGLPPVPSDVDVDIVADEETLWSRVLDAVEPCMRDLLSSSERDIYRQYAEEVLNPLLQAIVRTSVEDVELEYCLSEKYHVETFLAKLRKEVGDICEKCVARTKEFWGKVVTAALKRDTSSVRLARFESLLEYIGESIDKEAKSKLAGIKSDMDNCVLRHLGVANAPGGVSVRYSFSFELEASLTWNAHDLSNTLVFVLSRKTRMLTMKDIVEVSTRCLNHFVSKRLLTESCSVDRYRIHSQLIRIENAVRALLSPSTGPSCRHDEKGDPSYAGSTPLLANMKSAGLDIKVLRVAGFTVEQLKEGGFSVRDLLCSDVTVVQMYNSGFSISDLRDGGASISVLTNHLLFEGIPFDTLVKQGISFSELKDSGYNLIDMMDDNSEYVRSRLLVTLPELRVSEKESADIIESGDVYSLIRHLKDEDKALQSAALILLTDVLAQNVVDSELVEVFLLTETVSVLCIMISVDDRDIVEKAMMVLGMISYNNKVQTIVYDHGAFHTALRYSSNGSDFCQGHAVALLAAMAEDHMEELLSANVMSIILQILDNLDGKPVVAIISSLHLLCSVMQHPLCESIELSDAMMQSISYVMLHKDEMCVEAVVELLIVLCKYGPYRDHFVGLGMIDNIVKVLTVCKRASCKRYCLEMLHCISRSSTHRSALLAAGTVDTLQQVLSPQLPWELKVWICHTLKSLCKGGKSVKISIVKSGGGSKIIPLLDPSQVDEVREAAAHIISALAAESSNCIALAEIGAIEPLVELLHSTHEGCKEYAASALKSLAYSDQNRIAIAEAGAIDPLVSMMRLNTVPCKIMAARTLRNLSFNCKDNKMAIANLGGIEVLTDLLKSADTNVQAAAAGVLQNISYKSAENQFAIVTGGALVALVDVLTAGVEGPCQEACGVLRNLSVDPGNCTALMRAGAATALMKELECETKSRKEVAAEALRNLCVANNSHKSQIKAMGITAEEIRFKEKW